MSRALPWVWMIGCFVLAAYLCWPTTESQKAGVSASGVGGAEKSPLNSGVRTPLSKPIEQIVVGDRVLAHNPEVSDAERESWVEPDFEGWLHLKLRMPKPDGSYLDINILRPDQWLEDNLVYITEDQRPVSVLQSIAQDVEAGNPERQGESLVADGIAENEDDENFDREFKSQLAAVSLLRPVYQTIAKKRLLYSLAGTPVVGLAVEMDLPEMGACGTAVITDIAPCPPVRLGEGQPVTATFSHPPSTEVLDVVFESETTPIGVTDNHLFWSVDREQFLPIGKMEIGERVQTFHGDTKRIEAKLPRPGPQVVYNLEVYGEHVYYVGEQGILAHNMYDPEGLARKFIDDDLSLIDFAKKHKLNAKQAREVFRFADEMTGGVQTALHSGSGDHVALGFRTKLRQFAADVEAKHLLNEAPHEWKQVFLDHVDDLSTRFTVTLDGFGSWGTVRQLVENEIKYGGYTGWELKKLRAAGRLREVEFWVGGSPARNPFK